MEELEKWQAVNACETFDELQKVLEQIAPVVYSSGRVVEIEKLSQNLVLARQKFVNCMTRNYGLRSKVLYLLHYGEK